MMNLNQLQQPYLRPNYSHHELHNQQNHDFNSDPYTPIANIAINRNPAISQARCLTDAMDQESTRQRHKRNFEQMSQAATLSRPGPINFGVPPPAYFAASGFGASPSDNISPSPYSQYQARRTSHPHNPHSQRASEEMPERSQSQLRPRLEHRASQTVIDLTDEPEDDGLAFLGSAQISRVQTRVQRPPHLGRSDAVNLGLIDLTDDMDGEITITGERRRELPIPGHFRNPRPLPERAVSPNSLFVPNNRPAAAPQQNILHNIQARPPALGALYGARFDFQPYNAVNLLGGFGLEEDRMPDDLMRHVHVHVHAHNHQPMPGVMNYQRQAWNQHQRQKPAHVPPPPARDNFTRSPTEQDTVICPSCEEELVQLKDAGEPLLKKTGKTPSRKDREEHPFWVVKECGHVYCNSCFQLRAHASKNSQIAFTESKGKKKGLKCAVDDCEAEVKDKGKWVGVFL